MTVYHVLREVCHHTALNRMTIAHETIRAGKWKNNTDLKMPCPGMFGPSHCRQSHDHPDGLTYRQSIKAIIKKDGGGARGALGVFGRGLGGRVAASALQVS